MIHGYALWITSFLSCSSSKSSTFSFDGMTKWLNKKVECQILVNTSLCSSDMNEPDKSRSTSNMSLKDTFPLLSESYTLKITGQRDKQQYQYKTQNFHFLRHFLVSYIKKYNSYAALKLRQYQNDLW